MYIYYVNHLVRDFASITAMLMYVVVWDSKQATTTWAPVLRDLRWRTCAGFRKFRALKQSHKHLNGSTREIMEHSLDLTLW